MQFFGTEDIKDLTKASQTTIDWAAGSNLRIGGQAYNVTSVLTLDTATDIDTGAIANDTIYYVYAVVVTGVVSLKYSLSSSAPTGYSAYRKIGAFQTDGSAEIIDVSIQDYGSIGDIIHSMLTEEKFIAENGAGWVLADGRDVTGSKYDTLILGGLGGNIPDMRGQFLRGKNNGRSDGQENPDGEIDLGIFTNQKVGSHRHRTSAAYSGRYGGYTLSGTRGVFAVNSGSGTADYTDFDGGNETAPKNITVNIFIKIEDIAV